MSAVLTANGRVTVKTLMKCSELAKKGDSMRMTTSRRVRHQVPVAVRNEDGESEVSFLPCSARGKRIEKEGGTEEGREEGQT